MGGETSSSSSSSSSSTSCNYDVFLSFRGEDTRRNFTDHLYHALERAGIRTFRDNEELEQGEEIGPAIFKAIQGSRISIPVFSRNYVHSKWCLQELAKIMDCKKSNGQIVLPVFYHIDPSHVRSQTGSFAEAFLKHEAEQCKETVDKWREALREAGNLKGWDSENPENRSEADLINSIVEGALNKLNKTIGIDSHDEELLALSSDQSEDFRFVKITDSNKLRLHKHKDRHGGKAPSRVASFLQRILFLLTHWVLHFVLPGKIRGPSSDSEGCAGSDGVAVDHSPAYKAVDHYLIGQRIEQGQQSVGGDIRNEVCNNTIRARRRFVGQLVYGGQKADGGSISNVVNGNTME